MSTKSLQSSEPTLNKTTLDALREQSLILESIAGNIDKLRAKSDEPEPKILYSNSREILLSVPGLYLSFPSDQPNHALSFLDPMFDRGIIHYLAHALVPGATFVDIGANVGTLVALATRNVGASGRVIAVEPIEELKEFILRNAFLNGPLAPMEVHTVAAGNAAGVVEFQKFENDHRVSTIFPYDAGQKQANSELIEVELVQAHSLIPDGEGDLVIKIDAEGNELAILSDLLENSNLMRGRKTSIVFEYGVEHFDRAGSSGTEVIDLLSEHNLEAFFIHPQSGVLGDKLELSSVNSDGNIAINISSDHFGTHAQNESSSYEDEFKVLLRTILSREPKIDQFECECCGTDLNLSVLENRTIKCMFTGEQLVRYVCDTCGVTFGPISLLSCPAEDLSDLYEAFYKFGSEGDSSAGQEKTFYLLNPSVYDKVLNYACGDWSRGAQRLATLGWQVAGFEPTQPNVSPRIAQSRSELSPNGYDKLFSHNYFEHVRSPRSFFEECSSLLKPNGTMAHSTPCYDYVFAQSPFHLFFLTGESVEHLCKETGYRISNHHIADTEPERLGTRYECYVFEQVENR